MDVYVSTVAREPARSRTDTHADGGTFVPREATISRFAANPTRTSFANALKAYRNHHVYWPISTRSRAISLYAGRISLNAGQISLYAGQISFNAGSHNAEFVRRGVAALLLNEHSFSIMSGS
jgi:hypothetical protein